MPNCEFGSLNHDEKESTNVNADIESFLNYYVNLPDSHAPGYAVMVGGEWGAGKTFLVKRALEAAQVKYLYVSLYGMSSVEEVGDALFQQLHPLLASKAMRVASKFGKGLLRGSIRLDLDGDGTSEGTLSPQLSALSLSRDFKNAGERVLVFDDVERSQIPLAVVLGYINSFVEHEDCKAIVIAHEDEITDGEKRQYTRVKEKLIGKTLRAKADFFGALGHFVGLIDDDSLRDYYKSERERICTLFKQSETNNLRILKTTMWNFERFIGSLTEGQRAHEELMKALLNVFFILSFELRCGRLTEDKLRSFQPHCWVNVSSEDEDPGVGAAIEMRYPGGLSENSILSYQTWARILVDGAVEEEVIRDEIERHPLFAKEELPSWQVCWLAEASEEVIDAAIEDLEERFIRRRYLELGEFIHVLGVRLWLGRIGALSPKTSQDVVAEAKTYIDELVASERLPPANKSDPRETLTGWAGLGFREDGSPELKEVRTHLMKRQREVSEVRREVEAPQLLTLIDSDVDLFHQRLCYTNSEDNLYAGVAVLHHLTPKNFTTSLLASSRRNQTRALCALKSRFDIGIDRLLLELPWLQDVDRLLRSAAESLKPVQKDFLLFRVDRYIKPALTEYETLNAQADDEN